MGLLWVVAAAAGGVVVLAALVLAACAGVAAARRRGSAAGRRVAAKIAASGGSSTTTTVGFFHPYCNAGGGGERVLWSAVKGLLARYPDPAALHCVVYTGDVDATPEDIQRLALSRFGTEVDLARVSFVYLTTREWVEARHYPRFTMLLQSLGSLVLAWDALCQVRPDVLLDTMGYAFTLPVFAAVGGVPRRGCYVHYPTISTDMLQRVRDRTAGFNNDSAVTSSATLSTAKLVYYRCFAVLYGLAGRFAQTVMVNSTWTRGHICSLWGRSAATATVYPPCDTTALQALPLSPRDAGVIVSVAQFRPEKDHAKQVRAFRRLLDAWHGQPGPEPRLVLVGGCRNEGDRERVAALRALATDLGLEMPRQVEFRLNASYAELKEWLGRADVGLHTMRDEHFGIGVVEFLAAGAIAVAHDSAGPRGDIVVEYDGGPTGFLATTEEECASCIARALDQSPAERLAMQTRARASTHRFSEEAFMAAFVAHVAPLIDAALAS